MNSIEREKEMELLRDINELLDIYKNLSEEERENQNDRFIHI